MKIAQMSVELWDATANADKLIERCGRESTGTQDKITADSHYGMVKQLYDKGHWSVFEHAKATLYFTMDRGIANQFTRHRHLSPTQSSTRYQNYSKKKFGGEISCIAPMGLAPAAERDWAEAMRRAEKDYLDFLAEGHTTDQARDILPTCLKTGVVLTGNFRAWLEFLPKRMENGVHDKARHMACLAFQKLYSISAVFPLLLADLVGKEKYSKIDFNFIRGSE